MATVSKLKSLKKQRVIAADVPITFELKAKHIKAGTPGTYDACAGVLAIMEATHAARVVVGKSRTKIWYDTDGPAIVYSNSAAFNKEAYAFDTLGKTGMRPREFTLHPLSPSQRPTGQQQGSPNNKIGRKIKKAKIQRRKCVAEAEGRRASLPKA